MYGYPEATDLVNRRQRQAARTILRNTFHEQLKGASPYIKLR